MFAHTFKHAIATRFCAFYALCLIAISASPLGAVPGRLLSSDDLGPIISPKSYVTTLSNVITNTDVAPEVNVAPTIPIRYSVPYSVPVPVASGYPYLVPTGSFGRWRGDECEDDYCSDCDFDSDFVFDHGYQCHDHDHCDIDGYTDLWDFDAFDDCYC
ncbi:hypothetical protein BGX27_001465 [Mortierella sp. AM989]|nr:hypothetical protein BGX27_001465 [Mortierella sp. AM989]